MSWTPTDEQVRELARVLRIEMGSFLAHDPARPDRFWTIPTRAMLVAVGPMIAAQALRDAADPKNATWPRGMYGSPDDMFARRDLLNRADHIEKEADR